MITGFDFDGTLCHRDTDTPIDGMREAIANLKDVDGIFVATNQAGPLYRAVTKDPKFPTVEQIANKIYVGCCNIGLFQKGVTVFVAVGPPTQHENDLIWRCHAEEIEDEMQVRFAHTNLRVVVSSNPAWRKPNAGMLHAAAHMYGCELYHMIYSGDMDTDRQAAEAAGVRFIHVDEFLEQQKVLA